MSEACDVSRVRLLGSVGFWGRFLAFGVGWLLGSVGFWGRFLAFGVGWLLGSVGFSGSVLGFWGRLAFGVGWLASRTVWFYQLSAPVRV